VPPLPNTRLLPWSKKLFDLLVNNLDDNRRQQTVVTSNYLKSPFFGYYPPSPDGNNRQAKVSFGFMGLASLVIISFMFP
jgi:hypothetical protein